MSAKLYNLTASITFINYSIQPYFQSILHNGEKVRKKKKDRQIVQGFRLLGFQYGTRTLKNY